MSSDTKVVTPTPEALTICAQLSIEKDKPILLDYFVESVNGDVFIGTPKY